MSTAPKSIADLAADACAMPWEDRAPFSARYAFKEAVTPEVFVELLKELEHAVRWFDQITPADVARYKAAIAKAKGE